MKLHLPLDEEALDQEPSQSLARNTGKRYMSKRAAAWACDGKAPYYTWRAARIVARKRSERAGNRIVAYKCFFCRWFHIGSNTRFG